MHPALPALSWWFLFIAANTTASQPARPPTAATPAAELPPAITSEIDLARHFAGFDGCIVIYDPTANTIERFNAARAAERFSPCSTFKAPSALIGLETGVIKDAEFEIKWDRVKRSRAALNRDHTLRTAMRDSALWYFQELARRVGRERMDRQLRALEYGNLNTAGPIDEFWINGTLRISADEQVEFIDRLRRSDLPVSRRSIDIVRDIIKLDQRGDWTLYGKTGTEGQGDKAVLGWFVGWVESRNRTLVFAANMSGDDARGASVKAIVLRVLGEHGVPFSP